MAKRKKRATTSRSSLKKRKPTKRRATSKRRTTSKRPNATTAKRRAPTKRRPPAQRAGGPKRRMRQKGDAAPTSVEQEQRTLEETQVGSPPPEDTIATDEQQ
jgi:hypothetical protein